MSHTPAASRFHKATTQTGRGVPRAKTMARISGTLSFTPIVNACPTHATHPHKPPAIPSPNTAALTALLR